MLDKDKMICWFENNDQLEKFCLKPEDEKTVWKITEQPVGFVVLGRCCWARATIANALMGRNIMPIVPFGESDHHWKMVRFCYGKESKAKLSLPNGFEILEHFEFNETPQCSTVPLADLELKSDANQNTVEDPAMVGGVLEITLPHPMLYDNAQVIVAPERTQTAFMPDLKKCLSGVTPIIIYAIGSHLTEQDVEDLTELQQSPYKLPIFFMVTRHPSQSDLTESGQHAGTASTSSSTSSTPANSCPPSPTSPTSPTSPPRNLPYTYSRHPLEQLSLLRHCSEVQIAEQFPVSSDIYQKLSEMGYLPLSGSRPEYKGSLEVGNELVEDFINFSSILMFVSHVLQSRLLLAATLLQDTHARSLQNFILAAFDLSRDLMITPKRILYARQREEALYRSLLNLSHNKQNEIKNMITTTIFEIRDEVYSKAENFAFRGVKSDEFFTETLTARTVHLCTSEIRDMVIDHVNKAVSAKLASSIEWLQEKFTGTLERCLLSLEQSNKDIDEENKHASAALRHILTAAYQVEVSFKNSASIFWFFMQKMQQLAEVLPWKLPAAIDSQWKREIALKMLSSLNECHLARSICYQLQQKVKASHERFVASLSQLEERHLDRLEQREHERRNVRCLYAPQIAKLSLESSSLKDMIQYGMPPLGQELGRGHFGIVYSCKSWAGQSGLAVKSVALPTEKHWYSLAMEFFYHKNTPEHPRIVRLCGTVIDYKHDRRPTVLLIMERLSRDLYSALWNGIPWLQRLQVAIDVIQGIRYLHSQGLVHRDIKLHNVLLDKDNRAKLSDLGFCKVEVMMSGSVVGTPIHMAPELLTGHYDNSVDIYAFGVLFWYLCSGQPRLPYVYEQCSHKEDLFSLIKRGMRPERLPYFDEDCWELMSDCWHGDPAKRPLPGDVERRLEEIQTKFSVQKRIIKSELSCNEMTMSHGSDCWSTYGTSRSYTVVSESFVG
ncbi:dual serine/threonine and tyrosine protein kinase isoform X2 [Parasteatoda tepidariorum]|uniref:dual serine/threonine and tyrosine protein kinase isoform X2 n=1 Tax=Parasteatoda tepidariorum TaxID=114398 RepID=UPI00077FCD74|nr:dual serine/threonine and tyrosine protein kinase isoform X2 [Parasteatoda tepidariorum]